MAANIPGYYYDPEKRRYFKIENSRTAPSNAAWSSENVKKRRLEDEAAAAALQRMNLAKNRIARSKALSEPLMGGFFAREYGDVGRDVPAACFAEGMLEKGQMLLGDARWGKGSNVRRMYISGQDTKTGLGTAYATLDELTLISTYIPRDKNGRVHRRLLAEYVTPRNQIAPYQEMAIPQISDIKYHERTNQILITSRKPGRDVSMWAFTPKVTEPDDRRPHWLLGRNGVEMYTNINTTGNGTCHDYQANCVAPAPAGSTSVCVVGTNRGLTHWDSTSGYMKWLTPQRQQPGNYAKPFRDIFALDFSDPNVLLYGGRPGRLYAADLRVPGDRWQEQVRLPGPLTHVRRLGGDSHRVLVAALNNHLAVYDLRFLPPSRGHGRGHHNSEDANSNANANAEAPVLVFPRYRNRAHVDVGLAVDPDGAPGLVAAAHDDGTVALYSARSGRRLRCASLDSDPQLGGNAPGGGPPNVVRSMQFQKFPGDVTSTLFVGRGTSICAYSFGVEGLGDEA
ncbi:hypothetical protein F4775DRAFT_539417 [Biscogniauxia sp. FL1348]|nr:hypothetical protein F4775DRAFT_539417 [Biscogniauxia sp. FL1348]